MKFHWLLVPACLLSAADASDPASGPLENAYRFLRSGDYQQAIVYLVEASNLAPRKASIRRELGYAYLKTGEHEWARLAFEQALALDPGDPQTRLQLAYTCQQLGDVPCASENFRRVQEHAEGEPQRQAREALAGLQAVRSEALAIGPGYQQLNAAYRAVADRDYDAAIEYLEQAAQLAGPAAVIHKELGYAYLRTGETTKAREAFGQALRLDPADQRLALELAFLWYETGEQARALQAFRDLSQSDDVYVRDTARARAESIGREIEQAINRWSLAAEREPNNRSVQLELAQLHERRDEPGRASERYLAAWQIPAEDPVDEILLELARAREAAGDAEGARGAWLLASRSRDVRIAETAKDYLPERFPYAAEFRRALDLQPNNAALRRDLAYLLLHLNLRDEAMREFEQVVEHDPNDLLATAQLADLYLARNNASEAVRLLEKATESADETAAAGARRRLLRIQEQQARSHRELGEKSLERSYLQDARRELLRAYEINPADHSVALRLGVVHNLMRQDRDAIGWFRIAAESPDPAISGQARQSYRNLEPEFRRVTTSLWSLPMFSSRYHDLFNYSQIKTEFRVGNLAARPYLSLRFSGDVKRRTSGAQPLFLSENALTAAVGMRLPLASRTTVWAEAGEAFHLLDAKPPGTPKAGPDYRAGLSWSARRGAAPGQGTAGAFVEADADAVYVSRFDDNTMGYLRLRPGYRLPSLSGLHAQLFWNFNLTADAKRLYWANFAETGPGLRVRVPGVSPPIDFSVSFVRGVHLVNEFNPRRPNYYDLRLTLWYAAGF